MLVVAWVVITGHAVVGNEYVAQVVVSMDEPPSRRGMAAKGAPATVQL
jgi:hypothetical protein